MRTATSLVLLAASVALAACGDIASPTRHLAPGDLARSGGSTCVSGVSLLPTTAPATGVLIRESFGLASQQRPAGGNGCLKAVNAGTSLGGFWLEYPGSKNTQWIAPDVGQTWIFAACTPDPYELPSPLEATDVSFGCAMSPWFDAPTTYPTALTPITVALPSAGYALSMEGWPAGIPGGYIALGFTNSGATTSNLTTSGSLWLRVTDPTGFGGPLHFELRAGSLASGTLITSGNAGFSGWNPMSIRYSPAAGTVTLAIADSVIGTYPVTIAPPKYLAFEGIGVLDDLVLRQ